MKAAALVQGPAIHRTWRSWTVSWVQFRNYGRGVSSRWESTALWRSLAARSHRIRVSFANCKTHEYREHMVDQVKNTIATVISLIMYADFMWIVAMKSTQFQGLHVVVAAFQCLWFPENSGSCPFWSRLKVLGTVLPGSLFWVYCCVSRIFMQSWLIVSMVKDGRWWWLTQCWQAACEGVRKSGASCRVEK